MSAISLPYPLKWVACALLGDYVVAINKQITRNEKDKYTLFLKYKSVETIGWYSLR